MLDAIKKNPNIHILLSKEVSKINYREPDNIFDVYINQNKYNCQTCICAVPKNALKKWNIFKDIRPLLDKVECGTLCRIYSQFDKDPKTNSVWFKDMDNSLPTMT
jgi:monoamine oxidase